VARLADGDIRDDCRFIVRLSGTKWLTFSRPGKPTDNAYVDDTRGKVEEWRTEYNEVRPHSAIGDRTPLSLIHRPQHEAEVANRPEILT
jgi:putative transposase